MKIFVTSWDGSITMPFEIKLSDLVEKLKLQIEDLTGIYPERQKLFGSAGVLDAWHTFEHYRIENGSILRSTCNFREINTHQSVDATIAIPSTTATPSSLNKKLWSELTKVKLLDKDNNLNRGKFFYESSSFDHSQDDLPPDSNQNVIIGRLWLTSDIYKNHALRIEIHLPSDYPMKPPEVHVKTPIYHPNVNEKNQMYDRRLSASALWNNRTTLIEILDIIVDTLDNPKPDDGAVNAEAAKDFHQNRAQYEQKATAMIAKNGLPRS